MLVLKIIKWIIISILLILTLLVGIYSYLLLSFDTENFPENHGNVKTELFLGNNNKQPLIVGLGGSEGGNAWASNYWKAQRDRFIEQGYAFLALGYFGMKGTPNNLDRISLNGVHQAIVEAAKKPNIDENCIILIGGSKGAELSLALASRYQNIKSVVAIVPGSSVFSAITIAMNTPSFSYNNQPLEFVPVPLNTTTDLLSGNLRSAFLKMMDNEEAMNRAAIEVENINGSVLFISATQDEMWPSTEMSEMMMERLKQNDFQYNYEHIAINGDHGAPLKHFDKIEDFLKENISMKGSKDCLAKTL